MHAAQNTVRHAMLVMRRPYASDIELRVSFEPRNVHYAHVLCQAHPHNIGEMAWNTMYDVMLRLIPSVVVEKASAMMGMAGK
jgi:hypothetical protein